MLFVVDKIAGVDVRKIHVEQLRICLRIFKAQINPKNDKAHRSDLCHFYKVKHQIT